MQFFPRKRLPGPPPQEYCPATVEQALVVYSGPTLVAWIHDMSAWPGAFTFELSTAFPREDPEEMASLHARGTGRFRLGFQFPDGTRITGHMLGELWPGDRSAAPLIEEGGSGGDRDFTHRFIARFDPPDGDFDLVLEWAHKHVPLSRHPLSGRLIREAIARATRAFPDAS